MTIKQISLFLENKPGHLGAICRTLADARINIVTLSLADTQQFGIVRLIVEEWERAQQVLEQAGYIVNVRDVVAATVRDEPGGMAVLLDTIHAAGALTRAGAGVRAAVPVRCRMLAYTRRNRNRRLARQKLVGG